MRFLLLLSKLDEYHTLKTLYAHTYFWTLDFIVAYKTKNGKTKFSLILEADVTVQITRLKVRAENGSRGAKCGIVFLFPLSEVITTKRFVTQCLFMFMFVELDRMTSMLMLIEVVMMMSSLGNVCHCVLSL